MNGDDLLRLGGEAATLLEEMGYVACARLKDDRVMLDCWARDGQSPPKRFVLDDPRLTAQRLAVTVAAAMRAPDKPAAPRSPLH